MQIGKNNKGMSLIELIISMAISVIVIMMVIAFISGAFRVFRRTNDEVNLQMEAQTAINQIVNLAMEAKSISNLYETTEDDRYEIDAIDLVGYNDWAIIYRSDQKKLYLVKLSDTMDYKTITYGIEFSDEKNLLAEYVESIDISTVDGDISIKRIIMQLKLGVDEFNVTKKVNLRNAP